MRRPAPLRAVVKRHRGPGCQTIEIGGAVATLCGPRPYLDLLECGHNVVAYNAATQRRCKECRDAPDPTEIGEPTLFDQAHESTGEGPGSVD
jgi:hypothetical protein